MFLNIPTASGSFFMLSVPSFILWTGLNILIGDSSNDIKRKQLSLTVYNIFLDLYPAF